MGDPASSDVYLQKRSFNHYTRATTLLMLTQQRIHVCIRKINLFYEKH